MEILCYLDSFRRTDSDLSNDAVSVTAVVLSSVEKDGDQVKK
jgi:hypothetical protein